jgi:hypothetical protein
MHDTATNDPVGITAVLIPDCGTPALIGDGVVFDHSDDISTGGG